jgi:hypothetical protein
MFKLIRASLELGDDGQWPVEGCADWIGGFDAGCEPWPGSSGNAGKALRQRHIGTSLAAQTAGSSHGRWRLAHSPALSLAFAIAYFDSLGLPRLSDALAQPS